MNRSQIKQLVTITMLILTALLAGGMWWLRAAPAASPQGKGPPPTNPTISAPTVTPNLITVNTPTELVATVSIPEPTLNPSSVELIRVNEDGSNTVVAQMRDNGEGGDQKPGDRVFTAKLVINQRNQEVFVFKVSAAFRGQNRVLSSSTPIAVMNPLGSSLIDIAAPVSIIVLATVTHQQASLADGEIVTDMMLTISRVLKGVNVPAVIHIRVLGGSLAGVNSFPLGRPFFTDGETVILFLDGPDASGFYSIPDEALGTYHIRTSASLGQIAVIDRAYLGLDTIQARTPDFDSFLQASLSGQVTLSQLYAQLGISP